MGNKLLEIFGIYCYDLEISCPQLFQNKKLQKEGHTCSEVPIGALGKFSIQKT